MPYLLNRMPFSEKPAELFFRNERIRVRSNQIIIWVSLGLRVQSEPNLLAAPFPAILDTGHSHSFAIQLSQLVNWANLNPESMRIKGAVRDRGHRLLVREASLWVHLNEAGQQSVSTDSDPYKLAIPAGIVIYPDEMAYPRLPLLGLRAIADNDLVLKIRGRRRDATLRTRRKWWPFD